MILHEQWNNLFMIQFSIKKRYILWLLLITYHIIIQYYYLQQLKHQLYLFNEIYGLLLIFIHVYQHTNPLFIAKHNYEFHHFKSIIFLLLYIMIILNHKLTVNIAPKIIIYLSIIIKRLQRYVNVKSMKTILISLSAIYGINLNTTTKSYVSNYIKINGSFVVQKDNKIIINTSNNIQNKKLTNKNIIHSEICCTKR
eukprot:329062_1